jgi:AraC-like DNA-binding protein
MTCIDRPGTQRSTALERARALIDASFRENLSLGEIAAASGFSKFYFVRAFTDAFGRSPFAYRGELRTEEARRMLRAGLPIKAIAAELGFVDHSHFGRAFRRATGSSPGAYQRAAGIARAKPRPTETVQHV